MCEHCFILFFCKHFCCPIDSYEVYILLMRFRKYLAMLGNSETFVKKEEIMTFDCTFSRVTPRRNGPRQNSECLKVAQFGVRLQ